MKLLQATLCVLIFVSLSESSFLKKWNDDIDDFSSDGDFSLGFNFGDFEKDIMKEIKEMTQKTRKAVAKVLNVDESNLEKPNYKNSKTVTRKEGKWNTKTSANVLNEAKKGKHSALASSVMSYSKFGETHSGRPTGGDKPDKKQASK